MLFQEKIRSTKVNQEDGLIKKDHCFHGKKVTTSICTMLALCVIIEKQDLTDIATTCPESVSNMGAIQYLFSMCLGPGCIVVAFSLVVPG